MHGLLHQGGASCILLSPWAPMLACCSPAMPRQPVTSHCAAAAAAHDGNEVQAMMDILVQRQDEKKVSFDPNKLFDFADDNVLAPGALCQAAACALLMWLPHRLVPTTSKFAAAAVAIAVTPTRARSYRGVLPSAQMAAA